MATPSMNIGTCKGCGTCLRSAVRVVTCPRGCGRRVTLKSIKLRRGRLLTKCGAACRNATSVTCDCECGGKNHGAKGGYYVPAKTQPEAKHGSARVEMPPEIKALLPRLTAAAQKQYDAWQVDEDGYDEEVGGGGICHLIADKFIDILSSAGITATTVSSSHEVHVYTVARLPSGVWEVDIRPHVYEKGGGYSWTKIPGVEFDPSDIDVHRLDSNPKRFREYVDSEYDEDEPEDEEEDEHADSEPVDDWRQLVTDADYVPGVVRPQMPQIIERLRASGAPPPYEFVGAGMTSVVFRIGSLAYKVARNTSASSRSVLGDEAAFLKTASRVARCGHRVAKYIKFDPNNLVLVHHYVPRDPDARRGGLDLWAMHRSLEELMLPYGWSAPEFKEDSYVIAKRGPVLVDAGFAHRVGQTLVRDAEDKLTGRKPWLTDTPQDLGFALRMEVGKTLTKDQIAPLEARLAIRGDHGDAGRSMKIATSAQETNEATLAKAKEGLAWYFKRYGISEFRFVTARYRFHLVKTRTYWSQTTFQWEIEPIGGTLETSEFGSKSKVYRVPSRQVSRVPQDPRWGYRGMAWEEWQSIRRTGKIASLYAHNIGEEQTGLTFFGDAETASTYAGGFAPLSYLPALRRPGVVIAVPRELLLDHNDRPGAIPVSELAVSGPMPADKIQGVWYLVPEKIRFGSLETVLDAGRWKDGSRHNPSIHTVIVAAER